MYQRIVVSDQMYKYRIALRELWNRCYWSSARNRTEAWILDSFNAIKVLLLEFVVADAVDLNIDRTVEEFCSTLYVVPGYASQEMTKRKSPVIFMLGTHRQSDQDFPIVLSATDVKLKFQEVTDLHELFWLDLRYYKCLIEECHSRPDLVGSECLVDAILCEIELEVLASN